MIMRRILDAARQGADARDRFADLLRFVSIAMVVLGHWLMAVILVRDGTLVVGRIHAVVPWARWATWVFQVMPIFFVVGGFVNARSWAHATAHSQSWSAWVRRRAERLLSPLFPLLVLWAIVIPGLLVLGFPSRYVHVASQSAFVPIWFIGAYLAVILLVPLTWRLHRRVGFFGIVAIFAAAAVVDAMARHGVPYVGYANVILVWGGIHQLGYFWHEGRLPQRGWIGVAWAALALSLLYALVTLGDYPVNMVAARAGERSNASPPNIALFALALAQLGLAVAARGPLGRWLARPRVWASLSAAGAVTFTIFVWHLTAMFLVAAVAYRLDLGLLTPTLDARWWALRPLWVGACAPLLAGLVLAFRRFDRAAPPAVETGPSRTLVGLGATLLGITWLVRRGPYDPDTPWPLAVGAAAALVVGLALLGAIRRPGQRALRHTPGGDRGPQTG